MLDKEVSTYVSPRMASWASHEIVPGTPVPNELFSLTEPLVVGLTNDPERLVQLRQNRLQLLHQEHDRPTEYTDTSAVREEVQKARRLFTERHWPVIDVTRRSIEETAAAILRLLARRHGEEA